MPPQTRAQRRRQSSRQQRGPVRTPVSAAETTVLSDAAEAPAIQPAAAPQAGDTSRAVRRLRGRTAPQPVDYTPDYIAASRDLRWITIWAVVLFAGMVALAFSGLV